MTTEINTVYEKDVRRMEMIQTAVFELVADFGLLVKSIDQHLGFHREPATHSGIFYLDKVVSPGHTREVDEFVRVVVNTVRFVLDHSEGQTFSAPKIKIERLAEFRWIRPGQSRENTNPYNTKVFTSAAQAKQYALALSVMNDGATFYWKWSDDQFGSYVKAEIEP